MGTGLMGLGEGSRARRSTGPPSLLCPGTPDSGEAPTPAQALARLCLCARGSAALPRELSPFKTEFKYPSGSKAFSLPPTLHVALTHSLEPRRPEAPAWFYWARVLGEGASCSRLRTLVLPSSRSPWLRAEQGENSALLCSLIGEQGRKQVPGSLVITCVDDSMSTCRRGGPERSAIVRPAPPSLSLFPRTLAWFSDTSPAVETAGECCVLTELARAAWPSWVGALSMSTQLLELGIRTVFPV